MGVKQGQTQILPEQTAVLLANPSTKLVPITAKARWPFLPWLLAGGLLLAVLVVGLVLLGRDNFDGPGGNGRSPDDCGGNDHDLSFQDLCALPNRMKTICVATRCHLIMYHRHRPGLIMSCGLLWLTGRCQKNVAQVTAQNGRITYADVLVNRLAVNVTGVHISLEPDADDESSYLWPLSFILARLMETAD